MHIIGPKNWWLPGWLDRRLPTVATESEGDAPTDPIEPGSTRDLVGIGVGVGPPQHRANV
jgi:RND superfamily putative drug exporter